ncbi:M56 family metallopeptidase [Mucilaginibacter sp. CSA2-8R]|uniref:M56 family metallopeptidase n=1 Tax=Mucilaginibacter sp. CSA2-8R TaxID=3141542 RepID=UPI00315CE0A3
MEMLFYFGKSLIVAAAFYAAYRGVLKKLTFFKLNRSFLLLALMATALVPALHFTIQANVPLVFEHLPAVKGADNAPITLPPGKTKLVQHSASAPISYTDGVVAGYWLITTLLAARLLVLVGKVVLTAYRQGQKRGRLLVVNNKQGFNFSFFNLIFLDSTGLTDAERRQVFAHEALHCRMMHSADNVLSATLKVFFWFNPVVHLLVRELRLTHEFQVDEALTGGRRTQAGGYVNLLLKIASRPSGSLVNTFGSGSLKGRVKMLMQRRSAGAGRWAYPAMLVLLLPVCLGLTGQKVLPVPVAGSDIRKPDLTKVLEVTASTTNYAVISKSAGKPKAATENNYKAAQLKLTVQAQPTKDTTIVKMLSADSVINDTATSTLHMRGHVAVQIGNTIIRAQYIRFNVKEQKLLATKVRVEDRNNPNDNKVIISDSLRWELITHRALSYQAHQQ